MKIKDVYELVKTEVEELQKTRRDDRKGEALSKAIDDKLYDIYMEDKVDRDKDGHKLLRYIESVQNIYSGGACKNDFSLDDIDMEKEV